MTVAPEYVLLPDKTRVPPVMLHSDPEPEIAPFMLSEAEALMSNVFEPDRLQVPAKVFAPLLLRMCAAFSVMAFAKTFVPVPERASVQPELTVILEAGLPSVVVP